RTMHPVSRIDPFQLTNVADLGDSPINPVDVQDALSRITGFYDKVMAMDVLPMTAGGDHLVSLPVLRSIAKKHGAVGMIHFDAHTDLFDSYFDGFKYTHGTPFRRAIEEGCLDPKKVVQIGIRGTMYGTDDVDYAEEVGVRIIRIEELMDRGVQDVMSEARQIVGDHKTYVSFDIDGIDPSQAPGTGTPEIGGFSTFQAQQMVRLLQGVNLIGADLVEVSPPFDPSGNTAWVGASMIFELLCVLADAVSSRREA
ncbi:agmatinase, partial [Alphaproteobacteria bacterium]|nr:agmatinase [Alphaproteobacteria bacterium]